MPLVTSYATEAELAAFMDGELGAVADTLSWNATSGVGSYQVPVNRTLTAYGLTGGETIADATDIPKLEALAIREAWRYAVKNLAPRVDFSLDQQSIKRSQVYEHAKERLAAAEADAAAHDAALAVHTAVFRLRDNPYRYLPQELRVLP